MAKGLFITGTDTGIGKTRATVSLMRELKSWGLNVLGMKPVATGAEWLEGRLVNADALAIQAEASWKVPYEMVNPFIYEPPMSPHSAAGQAGEIINLGHIAACYRELAQMADCVVVEGVGGWRVSLNETQDVADLARILDVPVLMVVGLKLGCINHARLTHGAIPGAIFGGWIANQLLEEEWPGRTDSLATLTMDMGREPLGELPFSPGEDWRNDGRNVGWKRNEILRLLSA